MAGRPKRDPNKTQQEEIAALKDECVRFYEQTGVKQAAADWIGRDIKSVQRWEEEDPDFKVAMLRAKATFARNSARKIKPDNVLAHLYDDYKPPKQEIEQTVTDSSELQLLRQLVADHAQPDEPLPTQQPAD